MTPAQLRAYLRESFWNSPLDEKRKLLSVAVKAVESGKLEPRYKKLAAAALRRLESEIAADKARNKE